METSKNEAPERFTMEMNNIKSEISSMYKSFEIKLKSQSKEFWFGNTNK